MNEFLTYLKIGIDHILNIKEYDHALFIITLALTHASQEWKKMFILLSAFTIGHCSTLILSTLDVFHVDSPIVETTIAITILATCFLNFFYKEKRDERERNKDTFRYIMGLAFGSIHGLGFSNHLTSLINTTESAGLPLIAFTLGIEVGQLTISIVLMIVSFLLVNLFRIKRRDFVLIASGAISAIAFILLNERINELF